MLQKPAGLREKSCFATMFKTMINSAKKRYRFESAGRAKQPPRGGVRMGEGITNRCVVCESS